MRNHFSPRSLAFYGCAIASVATLFSLATAYGESRLKAPNKIDGRYQISTQNLISSQTSPRCLASNQFLLVVRQSGIYLTGSLLTADATESLIKKVEERPSLTGQMENRHITLKGDLAGLPDCQDTILIQATVDGRVEHSIVEQATLNGTLHLGSSSQFMGFTGRQEPEVEGKE